MAAGQVFDEKDRCCSAEQQISQDGKIDECAGIGFPGEEIHGGKAGSAK